jgi:hypothetical protein
MSLHRLHNGCPHLFLLQVEQLTKLCYLSSMLQHMLITYLLKDIL